MSPLLFEVLTLGELRGVRLSVHSVWSMCTGGFYPDRRRFQDYIEKKHHAKGCKHLPLCLRLEKGLVGHCVTCRLANSRDTWGPGYSAREKVSLSVIGLVYCTNRCLTFKFFKFLVLLLSLNFF